MGRRMKEKSSGHPQWQNRTGYRISKLDPNSSVFDVYRPSRPSELRIDESTYDVWFLKDKKFHAVVDLSVELFFDMITEDDSTTHEQHIEMFFLRQRTNTLNEQAPPEPRLANHASWKKLP